LKIRVSTILNVPVERQIPPAWREQGIEISVNQPLERCDAWVIYQGLRRPETAIVPKERVFFFCYEPPGLHAYEPGFLRQFSRVVTCQRTIDHPGTIYRHQAQPWEVGNRRKSIVNAPGNLEVRMRYQDFAEMGPPKKTHRFSAICSRKAVVPGHVARLKFVEALEKELAGKIDLFGYGFQPVADKWDALAPYEYHLVCENSCLPDYWTEKVADAFLAGCLPLVWGCPNLQDYFPEDSFIPLDPTDLSKSLEIVRKAIVDPPTSRQLEAVAEARRRVLEEYNLFSEIRRMVETTPAGAPEKIRIRDERLCAPGAGWLPLARALTDSWRLKR
jgi:hypothetical protein